MMTSSPHNPSGAPRAEVLYGVAGWSYADWEGVVYPRGADATSKMRAVAAACDLLEINTSFYRTPEPGVTAAWARRLERAGLPGRIVIKANRAFTHEADYSAGEVRSLREALAPLDESAVVDRDGVEQPRLLGLLFQFPHTFRLTPENSQRIERLGEDLADWTRVIELRHASWARPAAYDWLGRHGFCLANIDLPASGARPGRFSDPGGEGGHAFPPQVVATGPLGYLRLHGRNAAAWFDRKAPVAEKYNYLYTPEELSDLADRIRELAGRTRTVAVVGNNHYRGKALATVLDLANLVEGRRASLPAALIDEYPRLKQFAVPADPVAIPPANRGDPAAPARKTSRRRPGDNGGQLTLFD